MGNEPLNVLVFPGGTETGMEIQRSLAPCKEVRLVAATSGELNHADFVFVQCHPVKSVHEQGWMDDLNALIRKEKIDFVFPAHAHVLGALSQRRDELAAPLVAASQESVGITTSKRRTLELLKDVVRVPRIYACADEVSVFPVFVKPDKLYGSQGTALIHSRPELDAVLARTPDLLIQAHLPGAEVTCDCLCDGEGQLKFARARYRQRIRMGTSMRSEFLPPADNDHFEAIAREIAARIPMTGAWFFQMKADADGVYRLLEVEARIAGTMCLSRTTGVNFALLSILARAGRSFEVEPVAGEVVVDRALTNRYRHPFVYDTVYVDLDDTLVIHGKVNVTMVRFLYQALNEGKRLILVSKSLEKDKDAFLRRHRLDGLFDKMVWLEESDSKADVVSGPQAIFIDDSFSQRREVARRHGIPTFDPSMVEMLLNDRV